MSNKFVFIFILMMSFIVRNNSQNISPMLKKELVNENFVLSDIEDSLRNNSLFYKLKLNRGDIYLDAPILRNSSLNPFNHVCWDINNSGSFYFFNFIKWKGFVTVLIEEKKNFILGEKMPKFNYRKDVSDLSYIKEFHQRTFTADQQKELYYDLLLIEKNKLLVVSLFKETICFYEVQTAIKESEAEPCGCYDHKETIRGPFRLANTKDNQIVLIDNRNNLMNISYRPQLRINEIKSQKSIEGLKFDNNSLIFLRNN